MKKILSLIAILGLVLLSVPQVRADNTASTASVTNVASVASGAAITDVAGYITMTENTTTDIVVTATVSDNNGCEDIGEVAVTLYNTTSGTPGGSNLNHSYTSTMAVVGSGNTCTGSGDLSADYTETFAVQYYAIPGGWTALVTPAGDGATTDDDTSTIDTLRAIDVAAQGAGNTIEFGALALSADTGTGDDTTTVTNTGNIVTGVTVNSSAATAMTCTVGTVPVTNEKFDLGTGTAYASKTAIGASGSAVDTGVSLAKATSGTPVTDDIMWGFGLPDTGVSGSCTGTVVFTPVTD